MTVYVTRDSTCAADDMEDHGRLIALPEARTFEEIVRGIVASYPLPQIDGGEATWCLVSRKPFLVVAQQWGSPQRVAGFGCRSLSDCHVEDGVPHFHFSYFAQRDPKLVLEVLDHMRLRD